MGFMDKLGELAGNVVNEYSKTANNAESMSDKRLFDSYRNESNCARKTAYRVEIEKRIAERQKNNE